ncbi:MAG TPA: acetylglutamate kinase [Puia sp.]|nr:acetylglutamate kinase [Puia sp.]
MEKLYVIKVGGNIIDDPLTLSAFLKDFASINEKKILVHGGGKLATKLADQLGVRQKLIEGRRITDAETLKLITMVYAGYINKNIVAQLQAHSCQAMGICGADGNLILAHKRNHPTIDYGYVGDIDRVSADRFSQLLTLGFIPVIAPLTHDGKGSLLNTNADTIAQEISKSMSASFDVTLIYSFEKSGVLTNADDDRTVIDNINPESYRELKEKKIIFAGMIPKLDNAFTALDHGVKQVIVGKAEQLRQLIVNAAGTKITNET